MAINFPASPSTDETYTENSITWVFNGTAWNALGEQITPSDIGLGNVDNTADAAKPVSTAQQAAINAVGYVYSVKNYGATGDGTTDDTDAIQAAQDAAYAAGGGTLFFPDGTYRLNKIDAGHALAGKYSIAVQSNVSLTGASRSGTILKALDDALYDMPLIEPVTASDNVHISNMTIDGNKSRADVVANPNGEDEGINFKNCTNCSVCNVIVKDCQQDGIDIDGGSNFMITNCLLEDNGGCGVHQAGTGVEKLTVTGCVFLRNGFVRIVNVNPEVGYSAAGMDCKEGRFTMVQGCTFQDNARNFVVFGGEDVEVVNCVMYQSNAVTNQQGMELRGSPVDQSGNAKFSNCYFNSRGTEDAVTLQDEFESVEFHNCKFEGRTGITATSGGTIKISDCIFNSQTYGIELADLHGRDISITDTTFTDTQTGNAIRVNTDCNGTVRGCQFEGTTFGTAAINLLNTADGDWSITNNICRNAIKCVGVIWGATGSHVILNNDFRLGTLTLASSSLKVQGNQVATIDLNNVNPSGGVYLDNDIATSVTATAALNAQTWRNNYGVGAIAESGTATLVAGTITVATAIVPAGANITLTVQTPGGTQGFLTTSTIVAGTSFDIDSTNAADTSTVFWKIEF